MGHHPPVSRIRPDVIDELSDEFIGRLVSMASVADPSYTKRERRTIRKGRRGFSMGLNNGLVITIAKKITEVLLMRS